MGAALAPVLVAAVMAARRAGGRMFFQKFKTPGIAHVAYLIGDKGKAALVDPRRDVDEYLDARARERT